MSNNQRRTASKLPGTVTREIEDLLNENKMLTYSLKQANDTIKERQEMVEKLTHESFKNTQLLIASKRRACVRCFLMGYLVAWLVALILFMIATNTM